ncbi:bifunctional adenosylcobinamide kinase/adenosylcobinamide-phosphate guanylyltransferase [Mesobacillus foraminis]|uniref:bifunctional adenosylcobinamide kinase/adenosylcobinamide-phosphate guanylyltransferase n=1 Tax=Mesobacillus foraminis TaxID=279826 RepID=UPI000EF4EF51|nr:bifunctional adenosylcobinamide kinase/adenosylcobinamide-phosphate guanylyltransferase [Mesobacillus foraminis]
MAEPSTFIFISGGVRSGKSTFAEELAAEVAQQSGSQLHYIAAGQANDPEMKGRIEKHKKDRLKSGLKWRTWEQPRNLSDIASCFSAKDVVLLDCLTTLVNNVLFQAGEQWEDPRFQRRMIESISEGIRQIKGRCQTLIVVSNEVLNEPIGSSELVFTYSKLMGVLHQEMAREANQAYLVEAGIPAAMKGGEKS